MAGEPAPTTPAEKKPTSPKPRNLTPYLIVLLCATCAFGWYFFSYAPEQLTYFLSLRYRTMAVIGGQVQSKVANLRDAMLHAVERTANLQKATQYLEQLTDLRPFLNGDKTAGPLVRHDKLEMQILWRDIVKDATVLSEREFDDLLLADHSGQVVWQREQTTPRLGTLGEFLNEPKPPSSWLPLSFDTVTHPALPVVKQDVKVPTSTFAVSVNLTGTPSLLVVHPIAIPGAEGDDRRFYVAGLLSEEKLRRQAMHIPPWQVTMVVLPFFLLFLTIPFLKIKTLTSTERFSMVDTFSIGVSSILLVAILTILPLSPRFRWRSDRGLERFAGEIDQHLRLEVTRVVDFIWAIGINRKALADKLNPCEVTVGGLPGDRKCDFWEAARAIRPTAVSRDDLPIGTLDLDVIVWLDAEGRHIDKWTTKRQVTAPIDVGYIDSFREIRANQDWALFDGDRQLDTMRHRDEFLLEPLRSPTTSDMAFIFTTRVHGGDAGPPGAKYIQVNIKSQAMVDPLVPSQYGFAIIDRDGRVLFHSQKELSLSENFFEETPKSGSLREVVKNGTPAHLDADYHGRPHRLYVTPLLGVHKCPWIIVTFQEREPQQEFSLAQQSGAMLLMCVNLATLALALILISSYLRMRGHNLRDAILACFSRRCRFALPAQIALLLLALLAFFGTFQDSYPGLSWQYVVFFLLPLLSLFTSVTLRLFQKPSEAQGPPQGESGFRLSRRMALLELLLIVTLVGGLPAAGFSRISFRIAEMNRTIQSLRNSQEQWHTRIEQLQRQVANSRLYSPATKTELLTNGFASLTPADTVPNKNAPKGLAQGDCLLNDEPVYSYIASSGYVCVQDRRDEKPGDPQPVDVQKILPERVLDWISYRTSDLIPIILGDLAKHGSLGGDALDSVGILKWHSDSNRLVLREQGHSFFITYRLLPDFEVSVTNLMVLLAAFLALSLILAILWWAFRQLLIPDAQHCLNRDASVPMGRLEDVLRFAGTLVIGVPSVRKNQAVRILVGDSPYLPIPLPDARPTPRWVRLQVEKVEELARTQPPTAVLWVHVSKLESQLATHDSRDILLDLIEKLFPKPGAPPRHVVITSSIDPVLHMAEVFEEERKEIYKGAKPELDLKRWSLVLSKLSRVYLPLPAIDPWNAWLHYQPDRWRDVLNKEAGGGPPLRDLGDELLSRWSDCQQVDRATLQQTFSEAARAYYHLLWVSCTRSEKLTLIQLAQEGLINPKTQSVLNELVAKGLVIPDPPRIFNLTFREFLLAIERNSVVEEWEGVQGYGVWLAAKQSVVGIAVIGILFFAYSQGVSVQGLVAIITASGLLSTPLAKGLLASVSGKKDP